MSSLAKILRRCVHSGKAGHRPHGSFVAHERVELSAAPGALTVGGIAFGQQRTTEGRYSAHPVGAACRRDCREPLGRNVGTPLTPAWRTYRASDVTHCLAKRRGTHNFDPTNPSGWNSRSRAEPGELSRPRLRRRVRRTPARRIRPGFRPATPRCLGRPGSLPCPLMTASPACRRAGRGRRR